ncbi:FAD-dependent oxidoreductase [soil metagenome]
MDTPQRSNPLASHTEQLTFVEARHEYADVYTYIFKPANPVPFTAGEYGHVRLSNLPEGAKTVHELSFASAPHEAEIWFGVDGKSKSEYQKGLQALTPGDEIKLFKIKSHMTWPAPTPDVVMIAGGVGITPFRSMVLDAVHKKMPVTTTVVHVARGSFLYADEMLSHANTYLPIARESLADTLKNVCATHSEAHYYLAGSADFVMHVVGILSEGGIENIESDEFKGLAAE